MRIRRAYIVVVALVVGVVGMANATTIPGIATEMNSTDQVGIWDNSSNTISMYIPLNGVQNGVYGVTPYNGGELGTTADIAGAPFAGYLMKMRFL